MREKIFVAGLGATGSSAVIDLLKEVRSFFVFENEFRLFVDPGGLINLRDALVDNWSIYQTDYAIKKYRKIVYAINKRFRSPYSTLGHDKYLDDQLIPLTDEFLDNITELRYDGLWYGIDNLLKRQLNKYKIFSRKRIVTEPIYVGKNLTVEEFNGFTDDYINKLIGYCLIKYNKKHFCFNENFSCLFPEKILNMVKGSKMIIVVRDPRDVFATAIENRWTAAPGINKDFIKWENLIFNRWITIHKRLKDLDPEEKYYKIIKFEDLIGNYNKIKSIIFEWCHVAIKDHVDEKRYLNPQISRRNIGLWKQILKKEDAQLIYNLFNKYYEYYNY